MQLKDNNDNLSIFKVYIMVKNFTSLKTGLLNLVNRKVICFS